VTVRLWWRDDDAGRDDRRLEALLELAARRRRPVALAVVPTWLEPAAAARIRASPWTTVLQHGIAHTDHAAPGAKKIELGGTADRGRLAADLAAGRASLAAAFGERFLPVLVPPWNRIAPDVVARLDGLGFRGLSCFAGAPRTAPLRRIDTHVDAVDWRGGRQPKTAAVLEAELAAAVVAQAGAPVGLLTHHLLMDAVACEHLDRVARFRHDGHGVGWEPARGLFAEP